jgi:MFS family permease
MLTARERRWGLVAAIVCVTVFGLGIGQGAPLLSLILDRRGTDPTITGLNAGSAFVGVIIGPLLAPRGVRRLGVCNFLLACFALDVISFLLLKVFDGIGAWFALRILGGMIGSSIFTSSEAWINQLAGDAGRGRVIGLYAASLSAGFGLGPLLLALTGIEGWAPFVANAIITASAALPLLLARAPARDFGRELGVSPLAMLRRAPLILLAVAMFGLYEAALMTLLPIWGVRMGMAQPAAAATLSAIYFGSIALQPPLGWLSDKLGRLAVLRLCGTVGLLGALLVIATGSGPVLFAILLVWGGSAAGIYPAALGMAGDRFRGGDLVTANAAMIIAYGVGSLIGPTLGGAAMDLWNPQGLPALFVLLFASFLGLLMLGRARPIR